MTFTGHQEPRMTMKKPVWREKDCPCPWCGEEVSDEPYMDLPANDEREVECAACGQPVIVAGWTSVNWTAKKPEEPK